MIDKRNTRCNPETECFLSKSAEGGCTSWGCGCKWLGILRITIMAERQGFEPWVELFALQRISNPPPSASSATSPSLQLPLMKIRSDHISGQDFSVNMLAAFRLSGDISVAQLRTDRRRSNRQESQLPLNSDIRTLLPSRVSLHLFFSSTISRYTIPKQALTPG